MGMTNAALQALFDECGDRISCIIFDNKVPIFFGYPSNKRGGQSLKNVNELELKTYGGVDMVGVPMRPKSPADRDAGVMFTAWHPTEFVQIIYCSDENHPKALMDPFGLG